MGVPKYGQVTNGTGSCSGTGIGAQVTNGTGIGAGLLGTVATTIAGSNKYKSNHLGYISSVAVRDYSQDIETLKEENEALKTKVELLEIQFEFMLKKFTKVEKFMESSK